MSKTIFMTGVTGLIGRWTAAQLVAGGHRVLGLTRNARSREPEFRNWIAAHGGAPECVELIEGDLETPGFGLDARDRVRIRDVHQIQNLGALMEWGGDAARMQRVNVEATAELLAWAETMPHLERFVHISGYLVTANAFWRELGFDREKLVANERAKKRAFRKLREHGTPYETTKLEADILVRRARAGGVPAIIVNPSTVIGHAETGEAHQMFGIEGLVRGVQTGALSAVPGRRGDWIPLVTIDYLARFLARVPMLSWTAGEDFTVLHQGTPELARLIEVIADELGKRAPRHHVPLWLLKPLLKAGLDRKTGTPVEALAFINSYRFDTSTAERAAVEIGLSHPGIEQALRKSVRYLAAQTSQVSQAA